MRDHTRFAAKMFTAARRLGEHPSCCRAHDPSRSRHAQLRPTGPLPAHRPRLCGGLCAPQQHRRSALERREPSQSHPRPPLARRTTGVRVTAIALRSWLPIGLFAAGAVALGARTAARASDKTHSPRLLLAYALHSHLQQVSILFRQLRFWLQRRDGRRSVIIDYTPSSSPTSRRLHCGRHPRTHPPPLRTRCRSL